MNLQKEKVSVEVEAEDSNALPSVTLAKRVKENQKAFTQRYKDKIISEKKGLIDILAPSYQKMIDLNNESLDKKVNEILNKYQHFYQI